MPLSLLAMMIPALVTPAHADAAESFCTTSFSPYPYSSLNCEDVCSVKGPTISCDLERTTTTQGGLIYGVTRTLGAGDHFVFYGEDSEGTQFCCAFYENPEDEVGFIHIYGTSEGDEVYLYDSWPDDLTSAGGSGTLTVSVDTYGGDDLIESGGPDSYLDLTLSGGDDDDDIICNGACVAEGGLGSDTIVGSPLADYIYGYLSGASSASDGADHIAAGDGDDFVWGDYGGDAICGDNGDDVLRGEDSDNDKVFGGAGTDTAYGGSGSNDGCSAESLPMFGGCEVGVLVRPLGCP